MNDCEIENDNVYESFIVVDLKLQEIDYFWPTLNTVVS